MSSAPTPKRAAAQDSPLVRQALQLAMRVLDLAEIHRKPHDMCQATAQVARCLKAMGDYTSAESYMAQALGWTAMIPAVDARVDVICELSEVACSLAEALQQADDTKAAHKARNRARDRAFEAAELAGRTADDHWEVKVLLRASDVLNRCGDHDDAAMMQDRAITLMGLQPDPEASPEPVTEPERLQAPNLLM